MFKAEELKGALSTGAFHGDARPGNPPFMVGKTALTLR